MKLIQIEKTNATESVMQNVFAGYNHNPIISDAQFYDMENMSSDSYPALSPRQERGIISQMEEPYGLFGGEALAWVDGNSFYYDGNKICEVSETEKQFVRIGALLCIFPDKLIYNTYTKELDSMEVCVKTEGETRYALCQTDGTQYHPYVGPDEPDYTEYSCWLDTGQSPNVLKEYAETSAQWVEVATTYIRIENEMLDGQFSEYDAVTVSGSDIDDLNTDNIIYGAGKGYLIVAGMLDETLVQKSEITLKRVVPDMDFVTELDNRIWGCSSKNHEIYACKLGDPKNWRCYMGITSDSYTATVGTEGDFTGATSHLGNVLFFKEDVLIRVYGTAPSNYQITSVHCRGVQKGSEKSLITVNQVLYYKSVYGVYVYDGSYPTSISEALGSGLYFDASAGYCKDKYYICMRNASYEYFLFVYDTQRQMWHVEDRQDIRMFANVQGGLYFVDEKNRLMVVNTDALETSLFPGTPDDAYLYPSEDLYPAMNFIHQKEDAVSWMCETGDIGLDIAENKYITMLRLRLVIEACAQMSVHIQYDSSDVWDEMIRLNSTTKRALNVPLRIRRCDHFRLRFEGVGKMLLYSVTKTIEKGSGHND